MLFRSLRPRLVYPLVFSFILFVSLITGKTFAQVYTPDPIVLDFANFHIENNNIINRYSNKLIDYFENLDIKSQKPEDFAQKIAVPLDISPTNCQESLSSACLNFELNQNFDQLIQKLQVSLSQIKITNLDDILQVSQNQLGAKYNFLEVQLDNSIYATQSSLRFYQQLLLAYPLHLSYQKTQDELDLLIQNLKQIEQYIEQYPSKYNNVTTPYCK